MLRKTPHFEKKKHYHCIHLFNFQLSEKLKPVQKGPFKTINKPTEVLYELVTKDGKSFQTSRNQLI